MIVLKSVLNEKSIPSLKDPGRQFHQHFKYTFFARTSFFYVHVTRKKLPKRRSYEKFAGKTLMKLTPGGISQNFLRHICKIFVTFRCFYKKTFIH